MDVIDMEHNHEPDVGHWQDRSAPPPADATWRSLNTWQANVMAEIELKEASLAKLTSYNFMTGIVRAFGSRRIGKSWLVEQMASKDDLIVIPHERMKLVYRKKPHAPVFTADEIALRPERLRGRRFNRVWVDEVSMVEQSLSALNFFTLFGHLPAHERPLLILLGD